MALNENAEAWVLALESGEYKQGMGWLAQKQDGEVRYCCLGVACDLAAKAGVTEAHDEKTRVEFGNDPIAEEDGEAIYHGAALPPEVRDWLGLSTRFGDFGSHDSVFTDTLTAHNDGGKSFADIAAVIRSEPKSLFGNPIG